MKVEELEAGVVGPAPARTRRASGGRPGVRRAHQGVPHGRGGGPRPPRRGPRVCSRASSSSCSVRRERQVHAAEHPGRAGRADGGPGLLPGPGAHPGRRERAHPLSPPSRGLRLPVLQPDPQPHRAGERRAGHRHRPRPASSRPRPRAGGPRRPAGPLPGPALRRRAAARGDRAGRGQAARRPALRRADRGARLRDRQARARGDREGEPGDRDDDRGDHPQRADRGDRRTGSSPWATGGSSREQRHAVKATVESVQW